MKKLFTRTLLTIVGTFLMSTAVMAHTGVGEIMAFTSGFSHPFSGADHLLAMVAVGLWAAQMGGRATWIVPSLFVSMMVFASTLGIFGIPSSYVETGILTSVLLLGGFIAGAFRFPLMVSGLVVGIFAMFHGYAHGAEMPLAVEVVSYSSGFALATALLHGVGIAVGTIFRKLDTVAFFRIIGGIIVFSGIVLT